MSGMATDPHSQNQPLGKIVNGHTEMVPKGNDNNTPSHEGLRIRRKALEDLWRKGISGGALLGEHTALVDMYLRQCFADSTGTSEAFALVAVGGYGRQELFPFSDIDLLLLYAPEERDRLDDVAEALFYPLWDAGLDVGHGVRTPEACLADARKDFFFLVSLLDARLLAGSEMLFNQLQKLFEQEFIEGRRHDFFREMMAHRAIRYKQYGKHSYLLEPHIKECRGGFRDIQAMLWTAKVMFGLPGLPALQEAGLLSEAERENFAKAWEHLIKVRNQLHYVSGRKNDQLYFEYQEEIAQAFKYRDEDGLLGVEHFMRQVYGHMQVIAITTGLFFEHVDEVIGQKDFSKSEDLSLEEGIEVRNGRIHLHDHDLLKKKPYLLMRLFSQSAKTGRPLHYRTRKLISSHLDLVDERLRSSRLMAKAFLEVLSARTDPLPVLEAMLETGLLSAYIPEIMKVESLAQHDVYHLYTVDSHLLHTVGHIHQLREKEENISSVIDNPSVLFLAAFLHDIGKGLGHNHAQRGAILAGEIGIRLGLSADDLADLDFLVKQHLFLADNAMRRDLEDQAFIRRCAEQVGTPARLAMLYLLTVADAKATGPNVWNEWKAALLLELYLKIAHILDQSDLTEPNPQQGAEWMRQKLAEQTGIEPSVDIASLPADYLMNFSPVQLTNHIRYHQKLKEQDVLVFAENRESYWSILIMTHDQPGLLSRICGTLALHNLKVLAAQIFTWPDGTVVDELHVSSIVDELYEDHDWRAFENDLKLAVDRLVGLDHRLSLKLPPMGQPTTYSVSRFTAKVVIDNKASDSYTIIEVFTDDRIGLLYDITKTLSDFGINIYRAKIGSRADQIVDVFYVLDRNCQKITDEKFITEIRESLLFYATKMVTQNQ